MSQRSSRRGIPAAGRAEIPRALHPLGMTNDFQALLRSTIVNPTSTIQALALYIADQIKGRLSEGTLFED